MWNLVSFTTLLASDTQSLKTQNLHTFQLPLPQLILTKDTHTTAHQYLNYLQVTHTTNCTGHNWDNKRKHQLSECVVEIYSSESSPLLSLIMNTQKYILRKNSSMADHYLKKKNTITSDVSSNRASKT